MKVEKAISSKANLRRLADQILKHQYGVIARRQALASGISARSIHRRIGSGEWKIVYRGVYRLAAVKFGWHQRLMAATLLVGEPVAISGEAAAGLWSLEGIELGKVQLTTPDYRRRPERDFDLHFSDSLSKADIALVGPFVVTSPTRTLIDLGALIDEGRLEIVVEDVFRRRLSSPEKLISRLETLARKGKPGIAVVRKLMANRTSGGTRSFLEVKVFRLLREAGLPRPVSNYWVLLDNGKKGEIDFAYPELMVAIEVDGFAYHSQPSDLQADRTKRNALTRMGWRVVHITKADVIGRPQQVVEMVHAVLELARNSIDR